MSLSKDSDNEWGDKDASMQDLCGSCSSDEKFIFGFSDSSSEEEDLPPFNQDEEDICLEIRNGATLPQYIVDLYLIV